MMKRIKTATGLLVSLLVLFLLTACQTDSLPAAGGGTPPVDDRLPESTLVDQAIRRLATYDGCRDLTAEMRLTGVDGRGKRETIEFRLQRRFAESGAQTFLNVLAPASEIDKALLAVQTKDGPTEAFSYLPGLKKLAKLTSGRTVGFRGARVTVQELLGLELGQYDYRVDGVVDEGGQALVRVIFTARSELGLAFPKIHAYFTSPALAPVRFELLTAGGELQKRISVKKTEQIESRQTLTNLAIEDLTQQLTLTLEVVRIDYDRGLAEAEFTTDRLKSVVTAAAGRIDDAKGR